jgi:hypothetical protein
MNIQMLFDRWRLFLALCGERGRERKRERERELVLMLKDSKMWILL